MAHRNRKRKRARKDYTQYFDLGTKLRQCRTERGLLLTDVSKATGVSPMAISDIELGKTRQGLPTTRYKLERYLNQFGFFVNEKRVA